MQDLISVYKGTRKDIEKGYYVNYSGDIVKFSKEDKNNLRSDGNNCGVLSPDDRRFEDFPSTKIYVENIDFVDKAIQFSSNPDSIILNPASDVMSGGGVRKGSRALEEILCRRSTLLPRLEIFSDAYGYYKPKLGETEAIISSGVEIFKDKDYSYLPETHEIDVITAAAPRRPELTPDKKYTKESEDLMKRKIRSVLRLAIIQGKCTLLLPAWGCGAFYNPAAEVARCFSEVFNEPEFKGAFDEICFAILDDHNATRVDNPEGNYIPFKRVFP